MSAVESALNSAPSTMRTFGISWPLVVALLALVGVLGSARFNSVLADPDTYWHLAAGRWILEHNALPRSDPFSYSMSGAPWTPHEWLSQVVLAVVNHSANWTGLVVLVALVFSGTLAYMTRFLLKRMEPVYALLFTALAAGMMMGHLLVRPHIFGWFLMAVWIGALVDAGEEQREPPWWTFGLMALWANLHSSFFLGLALGGGLAADAVLRFPAQLRFGAARRWAIFIGLAVLAAMITPSGWKGLLFPLEVMGMPFSLDVIQEWHSPDFHKPQVLELWLLLLLAVACLGRLRLPVLRLIVVLGLVHLSLKHQRHIAILGLITPFLLALPFAASRLSSKGRGHDVEGLDRVFEALAAPATRSATLVAASVSVLLIGVSLHLGRFEPPPDKTPARALEAANNAGAMGPVLNSYNFGGYLIYRGVPVFIDGRSDMYGDALLKRYVDAVGLSELDALPRLLADYHIGWTLLEPGTPAATLLDHLPGWRRVHADTVAVVHVRNESAAPLMRRGGEGALPLSRGN
ncbi:hypothetical protein U5817_22655 [Aromatoleum evansii]|uniref:Glycosyltransferase RgtA/B/C/D-like domain-containing protein n=1 Tax=Aromatoleum evansii TaxID=59406 RepID=A0ABZ1AN60_AROEV|nr:hypothetical protein U5817_22655 [Aromatoleum evansii]